MSQQMSQQEAGPRLGPQDARHPVHSGQTTSFATNGQPQLQEVSDAASAEYSQIYPFASAFCIVAGWARNTSISNELKTWQLAWSISRSECRRSQWIAHGFIKTPKAGRVLMLSCLVCSSRWHFRHLSGLQASVHCDLLASGGNARQDRWMWAQKMPQWKVNSNNKSENHDIWACKALQLQHTVFHSRAGQHRPISMAQSCRRFSEAARNQCKQWRSRLGPTWQSPCSLWSQSSSWKSSGELCWSNGEKKYHLSWTHTSILSDVIFKKLIIDWEALCKSVMLWPFHVKEKGVLSAESAALFATQKGSIL